MGQYDGSLAFQFIQSQGWSWKPNSDIRIELEKCPYCNKDGWGHFYCELHNPSDEKANKDGLHSCHRCGRSGNLYTLREHLGVAIPGVQSRSDWAGTEKKIESMPDIKAMHTALMEDGNALDYLENGRGFSRDIITKQKLGLSTRYFRDTGEVRAIVYPYLVGGNCIFVHFRTLPTMPLSENKVPKSFSSLTGWDAPLYNGQVLVGSIKEVVFVEGEANVIAALDHGFNNICGVPGANFKKADWINTIDNLGLEKIYICYDKDKVGQKAAQTLASRIGIEKCWKIQLPDFLVTGEDGEQKPGKDLNEWFVYGGGTVDKLEDLKREATLFDVDGVQPATNAVDEFEDQLNGKEGLEPKYRSPWASLNKYIGWNEGDIIDITAPAKIGKTTFALQLLEYMADTYGEDGVFINLDMNTISMARKWIAHVAQVQDNVPQTPEEARALKESFLTGIKYAKSKVANREGNLYFCYPIYEKEDDIYKLIRDIIRRYGVKWIAFDNLQRFCDTTVGSKNRTQHLSQISKMLAKIGKDYNVQVVRLVQPHQIKPGQMVQAEDSDGSSQIVKDCDSSLTIHRTRLGVMSADDFTNMGYVDTNENFDPKSLITIGLSRYSGGGRVTLWMDGPTSTFKEYNIADIASIKAAANKGVGYEAQLKDLGVEMKEAPKLEDGDIAI